MSDAAIFIALIIIASGAAFYGAARTGPQQSLGGAITILGMVIMTGGLGLWMLGQ